MRQEEEEGIQKIRVSLAKELITLTSIGFLFNFPRFFPATKWKAIRKEITTEDLKILFPAFFFCTAFATVALL